MSHVMSEGITAYDFVQQVYYMQEKTLLDFYPTDDKFREVLVEANLVLKELEAQQDWTWLRETILVGDTAHSYGEIVEFVLPDDVYKLSMLRHDGLRLYHGLHHITTAEEAALNIYKNAQGNSAQAGQPAYILSNGELVPQFDIDEKEVVHVPIASAGDQRWNREQQVNQIGVNHVHDYQLRAVVHGHTIKMNRHLLPWESHFIVAADVQKHIVPFHVCNYNHTLITGNHANEACTQDAIGSGVTATPKKYLLEVPDPTYVIYATAARHSEGSPPALARVAGLQDMAQKLLSQMRQNDSDATDSDYIEWDVPGYFEVI